MTWIVALPAGVPVALVGSSLAWAWRRGGRVPRACVWCLGAGLALWAAVAVGPVAGTALRLFWVRALQVLMLLYVAPLLLARGTPLTLLRTATSDPSRLDRALGGRAAHLAFHPATTSMAMLATPWLLYLTPWYVAALRMPAIGLLTEIALLTIGFAYFYARLQVDPVPRRYPQLISIVISIVETLGDGLLGVVLWLGPLIAVDYYRTVGRGIDARLDQSVGAGILWIVGDVAGLPFLLMLMRALAGDERVRSAAVDAELDRAEDLARGATPRSGADWGSDTVADRASTLWWLEEPQLRDRLR